MLGQVATLFEELPDLSTAVVPFDNFLKRFYLFIFRERGKGGREGENHRCEREISISCLLQAPTQGTEPTTQACALTRNQPMTFCFVERGPTN